MNEPRRKPIPLIRNRGRASHIAGIEVLPKQWHDLKLSIYAVWNDVVADIENTKMPNNHAIEICIDADRLLTSAKDPASNTLVKTICQKDGFEALMRKLTREVKLT